VFNQLTTPLTKPARATDSLSDTSLAASNNQYALRFLECFGVMLQAMQ